MNFKNVIKNQVQQAVDKESLTWISQHIVVFSELQGFIPPLTADEYKLLEDSILREGCRESIIVWKQSEDAYILIDGHNRYNICEKHNKPFGIRINETLSDIDAVKDWMIDNQLGKRNVTEETKSYLRGLQYKREKQSHGGDRKSNSQNGLLMEKSSSNTTERLAEQHKVSPKTIQRDERYADMIDNLVGENKELKWKILNKEIQVPKTTLEKIAKQTPDFLPDIGKIAYELNSFDLALKQCLPNETQSGQENEIQQLITSLRKNIKDKNKAETEKLLLLLTEKIKAW
jgi:hypothetical protein